MLTKSVNFISSLSNLRLLIQTLPLGGNKVYLSISTTISAAADEGPDEMMCFPAGLHYLLTFPTRMCEISQKLMCLYANFSEKGCLYNTIYANFSKRENE